jgi:cell division transport system permease protein
MNVKGKGTKKNKISYWNSIFSISTVLFLTGFLGMFIWIVKNTSDVLKESVTIQIELADTTKNEYDKLIRDIMQNVEVKKVNFVSKDQAAAKLKKEIGDDFIHIIGYNPLFNALEVNLNADHFNAQVIERMKIKILQNNIVRDVSYPQVVSKSLDKNLRKISIFIGALTFFLLIIAVVLIDSTIRLAMFSDRFLIKSMQLVGATRWFIIRPYILISIVNGIVSALIGFVLLILVLYSISNYTEFINLSNEINYLIIVFFGLILLGIIISSISTYFAVNKYLRTKLDSLY